MTKLFYKLKVRAVLKPTKDTTTIEFELPDHLHQEFNFYPGQYLVIKFNIEGKEQRRSYSLNSCPFINEPLQVTVKRVKGGVVSNYVCDQLRAQMELEVMKPQGRFYADIQEDDYKTYFLFAAGSGITPILSIIKSVLVQSPYSVVNLFYGNKNQDSILFRESLEQLEKQYPKRLNVVHTLSAPKVWTAWEQWTGQKGRISEDSVEWFINQYPPQAQNTQYYICGPSSMNTMVQQTLLDLGVPQKAVHIEQFATKVEETKEVTNTVDNAKLKVTLNGITQELFIPKGKTILEVLKLAKMEAPYSCESAVCSSCSAKLTRGTVSMKACIALDEEDIDNGLILTCQSYPTSEEIHIDFD
ncbi:MAG: ferredoxin--NADP reductase [Aureispira sp.]|nr:ferredoxin--NADP reductase [Aureispira sp.]